MNQEKVLQFYEILLKSYPQIFLEEGYSSTKSPISTKLTRKRLTSIDEIKQILLNPDRDIRIELINTNLVVVDIDLYKSVNSEIILDLIKKLTITDNLFVVQTPSKGVHLYFELGNINLNHQINTVLYNTLENVDIIRQTIIGPNFHSRNIITISHIYFEIFKFPIITSFWFPLTIKQNQKFQNQKPNIDIVNCWKKGSRRRTLIALLKTVILSEEVIKEINDKIFNPPKPDFEIQSEILDHLDSLTSKQTYNDHILLSTTIQNLKFNGNKNIWHYYNGENWEIVGATKLKEIIISVVSLDNYEIFGKRYLRQIKDNNTFFESDFLNKNLVFNNMYFDLTTNKWYSDFPSKENPILNVIDFNLDKKTIDQFNNLIKTSDNITDMVQKHCPMTWQFFSSKLDKFNEKTKQDFIQLFIHIMFFQFLRNSSDYEDKTVSKILLLYGGGQTGKSSIMNFLQEFTLKSKSTSSEFAHIANQFESSNWFDKLLILFNDESIDQKSLEIPRKVIAVLKRATGKDSIRIEKKFEQVSSQKLKAFFIISMNYSLATHSLSDFIAVKRRVISIFLNNYIKKEDKALDFYQKILKQEISILVSIFLKTRNQFDSIRNHIESFDSDLTIIKNKDFNNYQCADSLLVFISVKCNIDTKQEISLYLLFIEYVMFYLLSYDTKIPVLNISNLIVSQKKMRLNPFDYKEFQNFLNLFERAKKFLSNLDPLNHLNLLKQNEQNSFSQAIFIRMTYLEMDLNKVYLESITIKGDRFLIIKGLSLYLKSKPEIIKENKTITSTIIKPKDNVENTVNLVKRNQKIVEVKSKNPNLTLKELSIKFKISKSQIQRILTKNKK